MSDRPLLAIVGPTASGKTEAAIRLAERFGGEIINADPQQFYRGLDVGTSKPTPSQQSLVPHHLIDILDPDERPALRIFQQQAADALDRIWGRQSLPILVGGSGQYVWGLLEGWTVPEVPPDEELRRDLQARADAEGPAALHAELASVDAEAASKIEINNVRRVIRALEVYQRTGRPISSCQQRRPLHASVCVVGLALDTAELAKRIRIRTESMFAGGLLEEVKILIARGYSRDLASMRSIGYREAIAVLNGEMTQYEAIERTARETRRLAKRQMAWFKRNDPRINWLEHDDYEGMSAVVQASLSLWPRLAHRASKAEA